MLHFRPLREEDLALVRTWLLRPHVRRWWDDDATKPYPDAALDERRAAIRGEDPTEHYLILLDGRPIGDIQSYRIDDHPEYARALALDEAAIGVDIFIGEADLVGRGYGPAAMRRFLIDVAFPRYGIDVCVIGPADTNAPAIRAYEKAGFRYIKTVVVPGEERPEYLLRATRDELS